MKVGLQFFATPDFTKYHDAALRKTVRSLEAQVAKHRAKLKSPAKFYPQWDTLDPREQQGSMRHWEKEIRTFTEQIQAARTEAERRGLL